MELYWVVRPNTAQPRFLSGWDGALEWTNSSHSSETVKHSAVIIFQRQYKYTLNDQVNKAVLLTAKDITHNNSDNDLFWRTEFVIFLLFFRNPETHWEFQCEGWNSRHISTFTGGGFDNLTQFVYNIEKMIICLSN